MAIYRWTWDPWKELRKLRDEVEAAFGQVGRTAGLARPSSRNTRPPVNVYQSDEGFTVTAEVPGLESENLTVEAEGDVLRLHGEPKAPVSLPEGVPDVPPEEAYHRRERRTGEFTREIRLPAGLDTEKVEAQLSDGILTVHLPKAQAAKPRKIEVRAG